MKIYENKHTKFTLEDLNSQAARLADRVKAIVSSLEDEKAMKVEYEQKAQEIGRASCRERV